MKTITCNGFFKKVNTLRKKINESIYYWWAGILSDDSN